MPTATTDQQHRILLARTAQLADALGALVRIAASPCPCGAAARAALKNSETLGLAWTSEADAALGRVKSPAPPARVAASRANAAKGGRPRKLPR